MVPDDKLIRKIKQFHSRKAADELFERYYREIYAYVFRQCGERELAMDLTQDIFLAVFQGLYSFDSRRSLFRTWLYHVASNKVTDYYRSRRYKEKLQEIPIEEISAEIPDGENISQLLVQREYIAHIMEIVSGYELTWVRIFQMKCFEDRTFAEIAKTLNISENTAKSRYYAIIKRLRKEKWE